MCLCCSEHDASPFDPAKLQRLVEKHWKSDHATISLKYTEIEPGHWFCSVAPLLRFAESGYIWSHFKFDLTAFLQEPDVESHIIMATCQYPELSLVPHVIIAGRFDGHFFELWIKLEPNNDDYEIPF